MAYEQEYNLPHEILQLVSQQGIEALPTLFQIVFDHAMRLEREEYLQAAAYERSPVRKGHANGYKPKTLKTRIGEIPLSVPQVREGGFYPQSLEKGQRSERALKLALAEMYVQGVSTRKVAAITEELCGFEVSSSQVSAASAELDVQLDAWRQRPLGETAYLWLDARYEKVRCDGQVRDMAVLIAIGSTSDGKRQVLGVSVSLSEAEVHWRDFLNSLVTRGMRGVKLIISDDHAGLKSARQSVFGGVLWQRCQFHLQRNAQSYVSRQELKEPVASDIRAIFTASDREEANRLLAQMVAKYQDQSARLASWLEENVTEGLTVFAFPPKHRRLLRTTNGLERLNREIRRRTRVATLFPNEDSCLRLVSAILMEVSEEWETGRRYLPLSQV